MLHLLGTYLLSLGGMLQPMRIFIFPKLQIIWDQGSLEKTYAPHVFCARFKHCGLRSGITKMQNRSRGSYKKSYWDCRLVEKSRENLELVTVEDRLGRSDVSQNLVKERQAISGRKLRQMEK